MASEATDPHPILPKALRAGSRIALISPAGPSTPDRLERAIARCHELGLEPVPGPNALARHGYLAGSDDLRIADFASAIADPGIDAIWALRGGYGTMRILSRLDGTASFADPRAGLLSSLRERPKAFIGFSDNTAIHLALSRLGVVSFHGAHAGADFDEFTTDCLRTVLFRASPAGPLPLPADARVRCLCGGMAEGRLAGGNLSMLAAACGTPFALDAHNRIVFIEDVNEPAYRIDRAFTQLRLAGCLDGVRGFAFGSFSWDGERPPDEPDAEELLREMVEPLGVPVLAGLPFGHDGEQWCIPVGGRARLDADGGTLSILDPAVTANS